MYDIISYYTNGCRLEVYSVVFLVSDDYQCDARRDICFNVGENELKDNWRLVVWRSADKVNVIRMV